MDSNITQEKIDKGVAEVEEICKEQSINPRQYVHGWVFSSKLRQEVAVAIFKKYPIKGSK